MVFSMVFFISDNTNFLRQRKASIGGVLNVSLESGLIFSKSCCLSIIFLSFHNVGMNVTDNGIHEFFGDCGLFNKLNGLLFQFGL